MHIPSTVLEHCPVDGSTESMKGLMLCHNEKATISSNCDLSVKSPHPPALLWPIDLTAMMNWLDCMGHLDPFLVYSTDSSGPYFTLHRVHVIQMAY